MLKEINNIYRRLDKIVRIGTVHSVKKESVKVTFGNLVSDWMLVVNFAAGDDKSFSPATVGEQVLCLFPGGNDSGVVFRGLFCDKFPAPDAAADGVFIREFKDGTKFIYDENSSTLDLKTAGNVTINIAGDVSVEATGKASVKAVGIDLDGGGGANCGVVTDKSPCPIFGIFHLLASQTVKTSQ